MPSTATGIAAQPIVIGVDACRGGWLFAFRNLADGAMAVAIADSFRSFLDGAGKSASVIIVDMPIGLADRPRGRACEREARRQLGARRSSVFCSPLRSMLSMTRYEEANAFGKALGAGLSKQAWHISPKIAELDSVMTPALQARIGEGHPELAFARLAGAPCTHSKRSPDGVAERRKLLMNEGIDVDALHDALRHGNPKKAFATDDLYDACALALVAEARFKGAAEALGDGARDARGLAMEIWR